MLDPVHQDIKLIIADQYQRHLSLKALAKYMALRSVEFVSALVCWIDDTYESLLTGGNSKEDVWWITTRVIISIVEDYLAPDRATPTHISFGSDTHLRSTLVWGGIQLVPAQDVHFFYMRSYLSALQNYALIFSTNFQFIFPFK